MKNKNIWLLPTKKMSRLYLRNGVLKMDNSGFNLQLSYQNIYITSDEEIKDVRPHKGKWQLEKGQILNKFPDYLTDLSECKLVILTTDPDLIKDGVQAIDDTFLEWFVKNPSCEKVEVRKWFGGEDFLGYKIIIPQEEPKQDAQFLVDYANGLDYAAQWHKKNFIDGPKLQVERMYSEEEVLELLLRSKIETANLYYEDMKDWFEQFKKK
jgi:hypothetical protein